MYDFITPVIIFGDLADYHVTGFGTTIPITWKSMESVDS